MLVMKPEQLQSFAQQSAEEFYQQLHVDLREFLAGHMPEVSRQEADRKIPHAFALCQHYGFHTEAQITRLSYILVAFPPEFYNEPRYQWLDAILRSSEPADDRLDRVSACLGGLSHGR